MARTKTGAEDAPEPAADYDFNFQDWPFYWLARSYRQYMATLEVALGKIDLDVPSWRVLMILHARKSASVSELSEHAIVKLSTMTKVIQRMKIAGLVENAQSKTDGRVTMVSITPAGEEAGHACWNQARRIVGRAFEDLTEIERQLLLSLLQKLSHTLDRQ